MGAVSEARKYSWGASTPTKKKNREKYDCRPQSAKFLTKHKTIFKKKKKKRKRKKEKEKKKKKKPLDKSEHKYYNMHRRSKQLYQT